MALNLRSAKPQHLVLTNAGIIDSSDAKLAAGKGNRRSDDGLPRAEPFDHTSRGEVEYLKELGVFDNRTLIKMWSETAAQTIFPARKVGALREGYEASFIALAGDPLRDLENIKRI